MKTLILIDGHALAYRTYFALTGMGQDTSRWLTKSGEPTAGTYGFAAVLLRILEEDKPDYLAVSFDVGRTFRDDLYAEYKGTREKMPDDLAVQIARIQEVIAAFNIPILTAENYEADDVLGTIARRVAATGVRVKILTGDRDLLQLADDNIIIKLAGQKLAEAQEFGPAEVQTKYSLTPHQYLDFKALVGDTSDNIPGVAGIGEKTATTLLQKYGSLEGIYAHLAELPAGQRKKLEAGRANADLSLKLSTIVTDLPLDFDLEKCIPGNFDHERVVELFRVLEFNSLLKRVTALGSVAVSTSAPAFVPTTATGQMGLFAASAAAPSSAPPLTETHIISTDAELQELVAALNTAPYISFDTETTSTDPMLANLVGISLAIKEGEGYYIPVGHADPSIPQLPIAQVIAALTPPLTNPAIPKYAHNANYDYVVLARLGLQVAPLTFDTMLAEWLCDPASHSLGLKKLAFVRLGVEMTEIETLIGSGKKQITMDQVPVAQAAPYAAADVDMTARLVPILEKELTEKNLLQLLHEIEMPLVPVLAAMEMTGITLDAAHLQQMSGELSKQLLQLEQEIHGYAGFPFNINSTQQLSSILFEKLKLAPDKMRKTASGKYSTAADVLEELRGKHPIIEKILEQRELAKLKSTYVDALPTAVNPATGRIHTSYKQTGAITGRIASENPNLQNIPIRTEIGRRVRKAFIAAPGCLLVAADYSQIELRIMAHVSQDPTLLEAFKRGEDIHAATASAVLGVPREKLTKDQRRQAKTINFGILYGQGAFGLTRTTGMTLAEAENFITNYFERFPGVKRYLDETKRKAAEEGYVETLLGRRRYFPGLGQQGTQNREGAIARARAEREAINSPIQGTAAEIVKLAMLRLPAALAAAGLRAKMLLQVHDELVLECPEAEVPAVARITCRVMEDAFKLDIPLGVEVRKGKNWEEMEGMQV